jgi:hypothetical protein
MMHLRFLSATCAAGFIFLSPTLLAATPSNEGATRELIGDRHFERGCILNEPQLESGRKVEYGTIAGVRPDGKPSWVLAQWHSKEKLSPDPSESLPSGALCYRNAAKAVTFGRTGTADADLTLEVIGSSEYGQRLRKADEPWVHLLVEQGFENPPALTALSEVRFRVSVRLKNIRRWDEPGYQPGLHAASFPIFISVQNKNRESPGYGQLLWFGVPVYDDRSRMPKSYQALDPGTGMFIYSPGGKEFMGRGAHGLGAKKRNRRLEGCADGAGILSGGHLPMDGAAARICQPRRGVEIEGLSAMHRMNPSKRRKNWWPNTGRLCALSCRRPRRGQKHGKTHWHPCS